MEHALETSGIYYSVSRGLDARLKTNMKECQQKTCSERNL